LWFFYKRDFSNDKNNVSFHFFIETKGNLAYQTVEPNWLTFLRKPMVLGGFKNSRDNACISLSVVYNKNP